MSIDLNQGKTVRGDFVEIPIEAVDFQLYQQVKEYKLRIASKFKSIDRAGLKRLQGHEFYASVKLDGEHAHLYYDGERAFLIRHRGYAYTGLPCLEQAKQIFDAAGIRQALIPGELFVRKAELERTRVFDVISLTKSPKTDADLAALSFSPFDILRLNDETFTDYVQIRERLDTLFESTSLSPPPMIKTQEIKDIESFYDLWVGSRNAEGLMIRSDLTFRYKLKAQHTTDAVIIGYTADDEQTSITSVLTALLNDDNTLQVLAAVEKGFSDLDKTQLYDQLREQPAESDYLEVSGFQTPFLMVQPKVVIEFSATDMVAERHNGLPIRKATLSLKDNKYRLLRSSQFASLRHCKFIRFRSDKSVNPIDLRINQITDQILIDTSEQARQAIHFPDIDLISREVYIKESKDKIAVRKIVVWKTNKERMDASFATYTLAYTDYSAGRKDALQQEVRISNSKPQILELAEEYRDQKIKKGWVLHKQQDA